MAAAICYILALYLHKAATIGPASQRSTCSYDPAHQGVPTLKKAEGQKWAVLTSPLVFFHRSIVSRDTRVILMNIAAFGGPSVPRNMVMETQPT